MRATAAALLSALRGESPEVVLLMDLSTGLTSPATVYLTRRTVETTWNGNTYTTRPIELGDAIEQGGEGEGGGVVVEVGNADSYFETLRAAGADFSGARCVLRLVAASRLTASPVESVTDVFYVESTTYRQGVVRFELLSRFALMRTQIPRGTLTRYEFPGLPRNPTGL